MLDSIKVTKVPSVFNLGIKMVPSVFNIGIRGTFCGVSNKIQRKHEKDC